VWGRRGKRGRKGGGGGREGERERERERGGGGGREREREEERVRMGYARNDVHVSVYHTTNTKNGRSLKIKLDAQRSRDKCCFKFAIQIVWDLKIEMCGFES